MYTVMRNWKQYFGDRLSLKGQYILDREEMHGSVSFMVFKSRQHSNETTIEIRILQNDDLLSLEFINPKTPGFTKQQQQELSYKYSYTSLVESGVEFNESNVNHFEKFLAEGLRGTEIQYIKKGKIIQSDVFQYYGDGGSPYGISVTLSPLTFLERLKTFFVKREKFYDTTREIQLSQVFSGI